MFPLASLLSCLAKRADCARACWRSVHDLLPLFAPHDSRRPKSRTIPDAEFRVLPPQPASRVSVGHVRAAKILATFPRVSAMSPSLCDGFFRIFGGDWQFSPPVSGRQFSISVARRQRLGSKWHETGSLLSLSLVANRLADLNAARVSSVGQMKSAITVPPASAIRSQIHPIRRACSTRSL